LIHNKDNKRRHCPHTNGKGLKEILQYQNKNYRTKSSKCGDTQLTVTGVILIVQNVPENDLEILGHVRRTMISGLTILENLVLKIVNLK
jgi:hypothetical protein